MGLDASVRCRCWEEGKLASPPPYAQDVAIDDEGRLGLRIPWEGNSDKHRAFDRWLEQCCGHPQMEAASEHISNWTGLRVFQQQLREFGIQQFPTLAAILPKGNDGLVSPAQSVAALSELDDFCNRTFGTKTVLADADSGEEIRQFVEAYDGVITQGPDGIAGVDQRGYFVRHTDINFYFRLARFLRKIDRKRGRRLGRSSGFVVYRSTGLLTRAGNWLAEGTTNREVFRSMRFTQELIATRKFRLTDQATGTSVITSFGVTGRRNAHEHSTGTTPMEYPGELVVERRPRDSSDFGYIVRALRVVFTASASTGNPVRWR